jgi:phenylacetate-CoA ligase
MEKRKIMYSNLYSIIRFLLPGGIKRRKNLLELEQTQWLSRAELDELQFNKIKRLIKYAFEHVPFYRDCYTRKDINPEDIKSYKDFQALPFLTKDDINNHLDDLVSPEFRKKVFMSQTGGSIGIPTHFFTDNLSSNWGGLLRSRCRRWYGVREGEKIAWIWGALRDIQSSSLSLRLKARIKMERYLNAFSMSRENMQEFAEMLVQWKPVMIRAYPSALQIFANYLQENEIKGISPKLIETSSEKLMPSQRQLFEDVFHCDIADCYSSRELYEMAYQCPHGGHHVLETVYLEIVDNDQVVEPGQAGEVVATSLNKFAMPFIRYKIHDLAVYETRECSCGRGLPVLREVIGRKRDFITTPDGKFITGGFFELFFSLKPEVHQFQVHQTDLKHLDIRLVCRQDINSSWLHNVRSELRARMGENMEINLNIVNHIQLTQAGKLQYVISNVKPDSIKA